jgi:type III restriction enzyme
MIRLTQVILDPATDLQKTRTVVAQSKIEEQLHGASLTGPVGGPPQTTPIFAGEAERGIAQAAYKEIQKYESLPSSQDLLKPEIQARIVEEVKKAALPSQQGLPGMTTTPDIAAVVKRTAQLVVQQTIDIPRILVVPMGEVTTGFHPFTLETSAIHYQPVSQDILIHHLRTHQQEILSVGGAHESERRLEDYLVRAVIDFDDISYDEHADLLYDLAGQMVAHLKSYLPDEAAVRNVLQYYQRPLAEFIHVQMQQHQWERAAGHDVVVSKGFTALKPCAYTASAIDPVHDFRQTVADKSKIAQLLFGGFKRCLYPVQKFQSDSERKLSIILDRDAQKWFKPALGQFQIFYKSGVDQHEYQPDFVAETSDCLYMLEPKARNEMTDAEVLAKKDAAVTWCGRASSHAISNGGKPWKYVLIPHDAIAENMTLGGLVSQFTPAP